MPLGRCLSVALLAPTVDRPPPTGRASAARTAPASPPTRRRRPPSGARRRISSGASTLPGPGKSCPIVVGDRVILTCWTGAESARRSQAARPLLRPQHGRASCGRRKSRPPSPDEPFREHVHRERLRLAHARVRRRADLLLLRRRAASSRSTWTATTCGEPSVGTGTDPNNWGTASSPILYKDLVIVTAASESTAMVALDKDTGKEVWRQEGDGLEAPGARPCWSTRARASRIWSSAVPGELWGMNPDTGKLRWYAEGPQSRSICCSAIADDGVAYVHRRPRRRVDGRPRRRQGRRPREQHAMDQKLPRRHRHAGRRRRADLLRSPAACSLPRRRDRRPGVREAAAAAAAAAGAAQPGRAGRPRCRLRQAAANAAAGGGRGGGRRRHSRSRIIPRP